MHFMQFEDRTGPKEGLPHAYVQLLNCTTAALAKGELPYMAWRYKGIPENIWNIFYNPGVIACHCMSLPARHRVPSLWPVCRQSPTKWLGEFPVKHLCEIRREKKKEKCGSRKNMQLIAVVSCPRASMPGKYAVLWLLSYCTHKRGTYGMYCQDLRVKCKYWFTFVSWDACVYVLQYWNIYICIYSK